MKTIYEKKFARKWIFWNTQKLMVKDIFERFLATDLTLSF